MILMKARAKIRAMLSTSHSIVESGLWGIFIGGVVFLLLLDLLIFHRKAHEVSTREALVETTFWISIALGFNLWFYFQYGTGPAVDFLTGYLVEKSLSVDNLFVILLLFQSFSIPAALQHRVLFWGILGAIVMRGVLIILGAGLVHRFDWIIYIFGGILVFSAYRFLTESDDPDSVRESWLVKIMTRAFPSTSEFNGQKFFLLRDGRALATPLFLCLVAIEATDLVFAVDSIPAVLAITTDPFIAFASNILAILGLRSLYFVIADWVKRLRYLKPGLAAILGFVGIKMILSGWYHLPSWISLLVISSILITASLGSWYATRSSKLP